MDVFYGYMMFEYLVFVIKFLYYEYLGSVIKFGICKLVLLDRVWVKWILFGYFDR